MELGECRMPGCVAPASLSYRFDMTVWDHSGSHIGVFERWVCVNGCHYDVDTETA